MSTEPQKVQLPVVRGKRDSPRCHLCPLAGAQGKPNRPVPGVGAPKPKWIALGEGPGANEVFQGMPFVGASGRMLMRVLRALKLEREELWITNMTMCRPSPGTNEEDLKRARTCCRPRLNAELTQFPGVPLLAMGKVAAQGLLGDKFKITEMSSTLHDADIDGSGTRPIIPTIHPAAILRGGDGGSNSDRAVDLLFWNFTYDAAKIDALADGKAVRFSDDIEIEASDPRRARQLMQEMYEDAKAAGACTIDVETDGINARHVDLTAIAVATTDWALSLSYEVCDTRVWQMFRWICNDPDIALTFHNRIFDETVLDAHGVKIRGPVHDTLLKHHAAFPGASHKLQHVGGQFFAIRPWKAEFRKGTDEHGRPDTVENLLTYNARDALVTARLNPELDECMVRTQTTQVYEIDNALAPIARRMEKIGVPIDQSVNARLHVHFTAIIERTRDFIETKARDPQIRTKWLDHLALIRARVQRKRDPADFLDRHMIRVRELTFGVTGKKGQILKGKEPAEFSISNNDHIAAYLQACGHRLYRTTPTGKPSTKKDILEELTYIEDVRIILEYREAAKLDKTFVVGVRNKLEFSKLNGAAVARLHPNWDIHKITGRWSSKPATQNWPKNNMRGRPNLREQVVAPKGKKLVGADFAQLEARIIGLLSGDPLLVTIFMENFGTCDAGCVADAEPVKFCPVHDIHTVFAVEVFANFLAMDKGAKKELRDLVKRGEYGGFYGGAIETLYASIVKEFPDVSMADVAKIVQIIAQKMPLVQVWHQKLVRQAIQDGCIRSAILGRMRAFPLGNCDLNVVYNFPVQSTAADIMDLGLLALVPTLPTGAEVILQVHDALVVECDEADAEDVAQLVTDALSQEFEIDGVQMRFPANADIGDTWAQL